jgi:hypothetical protein
MQGLFFACKIHLFIYCLFVVMGFEMIIHHIQVVYSMNFISCLPNNRSLKVNWF